MESAVRDATLKKDDVINNLKDRLSWRDKMLEMFTKLLVRNNLWQICGPFMAIYVKRKNTNAHELLTNFHELI